MEDKPTEFSCETKCTYSLVHTHSSSAVPVWLQYAQFAVEHMSLMPGGVAFPREVFEKAIVSCGLHVAKAGLLWTTYLEFELAVMTSLQVKLSSKFLSPVYTLSNFQFSYIFIHVHICMLKRFNFL